MFDAVNSIVLCFPTPTPRQSKVGTLRAPLCCPSLCGCGSERVFEIYLKCFLLSLFLMVGSGQFTSVLNRECYHSRPPFLDPPLNLWWVGPVCLFLCGVAVSRRVKARSPMNQAWFRRQAFAFMPYARRAPRFSCWDFRARLVVPADTHAPCLLGTFMAFSHFCFIS